MLILTHALKAVHNLLQEKKLCSWKYLQDLAYTE